MKTKNKWKKERNLYLQIVFNGIVKNKSIKEIHKELVKSTINPNKKNLAYAIKVADKLDKKSNRDADYIFLIMSKWKCFERTLKTINQDLKESEDKRKTEIIKGYIEENRNSDKWFYVCSHHLDVAKDHEDYQGKTYVDERGLRIKEVREYAKAHNLKTLQWVTGKPVWLVTRPHCRHYMTAYSLEEIPYARPDSRKIGPAWNQTPARASLSYYVDRLDFLNGLTKSPKVKAQISKTKLMIDKWRGQI